MLRAIPDELVKKARFAFVEALGMKGLCEPEEFVIEVVADFVQEGPEEGPEGHHPAALSRAHPDGHSCGSPALSGGVEAVEFPPGPRRAGRQHFDLDRRYLEPGRKAGYELLAGPFRPLTILPFQRISQLCSQRLEYCRLGQVEGTDLIALVVNALISAGESIVVGKDHRRNRDSSLGRRWRTRG